MFVKIRSISFLLVCNILFTSSCIRSKERRAGKADIYKSETKVTVDKAAIKKVKKRKEVLHKAHLSNAWYTQDPKILDIEISDYFALAQNNFYAEVDANSVRAIIVPHAGHDFSGLCAATAYQTLLTTKNLYSKDLKNKNISKVIILAPSHTKYFNGVALPGYTKYQTPLGILKTDQDSIDALSKEKHFAVHADAHNTEHAIEIQLPFLQKSIEKFTIVPIIVGNLSAYEQVQSISNSLKKIIDEKTLVVVSTDFTHYGKNYNYTPFNKFISGQIRYIDSLAVQAITSKSQESFEKALQLTKTTICGRNPLRIILNLLEEEYALNIEPRLTCYYTSAHIAQARGGTSMIDIPKLIGSLPDKTDTNSVSYVGIVFTQQPLKKLKKENQLTEYEKKSLVRLSREIIENELKKPNQQTPEHLLWPIVSPGIEKTSGVFVTLNSIDTGKLRGCIGKILSYDPIYKTTIKMSKSAAFKDRRFPPLSQQEVKKVAIEISVLTPPEQVGSFEEIVIGTHGIILNKFERNGSLKASAVFLPQVARNNNWNLRTTLEQLSIKAGIGKDGWQDGAEIQVFEVLEIHEEQT